MFLRWVTRNGERVLQQQIKAWSLNGGIDIFVDVPTHQEPKKVSVEDELSKYLHSGDGAACYGYMNYQQSEVVAKSAIEFFKARFSKGGCPYSDYKTNEAYAYARGKADAKKALFGEE